MRFSLLCLLFTITSCQDYNSNSGDRKYGPVVLNEPDPNFARAYSIIQNRCVSCHDKEHDLWASYTNNDAWVNSGLVVAGNTSNSDLIRRIINTGNSESNMPPGGSPLSNDEYNHLIKWVTEFQ